MANPHKGEVELKAGDETYVLRYSIDAICDLEERLGKSFPVLASEMADPTKFSVGLVRNVLHAGLCEKHPDISVKQAGELILSAGGLIAVMEKVSAAFAAAFPKSEASGTPRPQNRRQRRADGSGKNSTKDGSPST